MAASVQTENGDSGFQIAPMVDVVFVLLLFFMASASSRDSEKEIAVNLPARAGAGHTAIVVAITPGGEVTVNDQPVGAAQDHRLEGLREWFRGAIEEFGDDDPVLIRPAGDVRQQRIIDVLDAVAASGVKKLSFG